MRAVVVRQFGDPGQLRVEEVATPEPKGDEILVAVKAAAINPSDVKNVMGLMHGTVLPRIPGRDFAGVVVKGPGELIGREVWGTGGDISRTRDGSHAEYLLLPVKGVAIKPKGLSMEAAATSGLSFVTAWQAMVAVAGTAAGETVVVLGASGAVGSAAVQVGKYRGARVIGVVRSEEDAAEVRRLGAEEVVNSKQVNVAEAVKNLTAGKGAAVVFDGSGMMFSEAVEAAGADARVPVIAAPADGKVSFNLRTLYRKMLQVRGIDTLRLDAGACAELLRELAPGFESGRLTAKAGRPMALEAVAEAYQQAGRGGERIVLRPAAPAV